MGLNMRRFIDMVLAGLGLLVLAPLVVPVAIALRLTGEGEVFYVQERVGLGGRMFPLYKFATMLKNSPSLGAGTVTVEGDPRVLPMGRLLRKTKINELPQLLNVFRGDMSLIGPRPQAIRCFEAFPQRSQAAIIRVQPGLSGIGSIVFRDEEHMMEGRVDPRGFYDDVIAPYKGLLEEWYVDNRGLRTYVWCVLLTAWVIFMPHSRAVWRVFPDLPVPPADMFGGEQNVGR